MRYAPWCTAMTFSACQQQQHDWLGTKLQNLSDITGELRAGRAKLGGVSSGPFRKRQIQRTVNAVPLGNRSTAHEEDCPKKSISHDTDAPNRKIGPGSMVIGRGVKTADLLVENDACAPISLHFAADRVDIQHSVSMWMRGMANPRGGRTHRG